MDGNSSYKYRFTNSTGIFYSSSRSSGDVNCCCNYNPTIPTSEQKWSNLKNKTTIIIIKNVLLLWEATWSFLKMEFYIQMNLLCAATCFSCVTRVGAHNRFYCIYGRDTVDTRILLENGFCKISRKLGQNWWINRQKSCNPRWSFLIWQRV